MRTRKPSGFPTSTKPSQRVPTEIRSTTHWRLFETSETEWLTTRTSSTALKANDAESSTSFGCSLPTRSLTSKPTARFPDPGQATLGQVLRPDRTPCFLGHLADLGVSEARRLVSLTLSQQRMFSLGRENIEMRQIVENIECMDTLCTAVIFITGLHKFQYSSAQPHRPHGEPLAGG